MEVYGRDQTMARYQLARQTEWSPRETGLEESMWRLGLDSSETYPERPGVPDCPYYMRNGLCGYGSKCRYNHPRDRASVEAAVRATRDYPERVGEPPCQFYLKTGTCKFGASCKFHHPKTVDGSLNQVPLNIHGYPIREGEKECSYYLKTGQCKFGMMCKFHHPHPADTTISASAPQFYPSVQSSIPEQYGGSSASFRAARPPLLPGSYMQGTYGPMLLSPSVVPIPGWSPYSAPVSPVLSPSAQHAVATPSLYGVAQLSSSSPSLAGVYPSFSSSTGPPSGNLKDRTFPERPGEPECQYYLRTGDCKFGSTCKFHHPRYRVPPRANCVLSPMGLPLRPGVQPCAFYLQNGYCKFGSSCKFDHPVGTTIRYSPSASSLANAPVAPVPVGSLRGSELRPDNISSSQKNFYLTGITASKSSSSVSAGLIFSENWSLPFSSDSQLSGQTSLPITSNRITRQGREIRRSF